VLKRDINLLTHQPIPEVSLQEQGVEVEYGGDWLSWGRYNEDIDGN